MSRILGWALLLAAFVVPVELLAHARLKSSRPGQGAHLVIAPTRIELDFTEAPELALTTITLTTAEGARVPLGPLHRAGVSGRTAFAEILGVLRAGSYKIAWTTAAVDGHPERGVLTFDVAMDAAIAPAATGTNTSSMRSVADDAPEFGVESPAYVLIRWLEFLALLVVIGAVAFRQLVLGFVKRKQEPDSPMIPDAARNAARWGHRASALLLLVVVARLVAQSYMMHGGMGGLAPSMMGSMVTETLWGRGWLLQLIAVAIAGLGFHMARRADVPRWWLVATSGALLLAFTPGLSGHASASPNLRTLAILADGMHVMGGGGWLGSLLMVVFVGIPAALRLPAGRRAPMVAAVFNAFSPTAVAFAGVIAATGIFAAWLHLGSLPALWTSSYGQTLLVKLGILFIVAGTGAYNWLRVKPQLGLEQSAAKIRRSALIELAVGVLVVFATAVLVALPTPATQ